MDRSETPLPQSVLVVESDPGRREAIESHLQGAGFETLGVDDADDAVALLRNRSDIGLIHCDGCLMPRIRWPG